MVRHICPTDRLPFLIQDELSQEESGHLLMHLEDCSSCQSDLETLTANPKWWMRTTRGLSGAELDASGHIPESDKSVCSVEALLQADNDHNPQTVSSTSGTAMFDPPIHPELLGRIDEFDVEEKIGQGGMGIVFRGFDRVLNRSVAVKMMAPQLGANSVARKRFAREAQAAAAVVHPNVVPIYRVSSSPERPYIAMALVDGRSLQEHVVHSGTLESKDIVRISMQIADGLAAAHRQGLIHRDIKPANILMEKDVSRVMITDFGLARAVDDIAMTQTGCLAGTPNYMSPEQVTGVDIDHRSDLFSLGGVMYFLATGQEPFCAESAFAVIHKIIREDSSPARNLNTDIPETLSRIIGRLLEKKPADRIQSANQVQQLLTNYLAHLQDPKHHAQPPVKATSAERKKVLKRVGWGVTAIGLLLACLMWGLSGWSGLGPESPDANQFHGSGFPVLRESDEREEHEHRGSRHHDESEKGRDADSREHD